jgi:hypothetical protein
VLPPQLVAVDVIVAVNADVGCVIATVVLPIQPLLSAVVMVYKPAFKAFCEAPDKLPGVQV